MKLEITKEDLKKFKNKDSTVFEDFAGELLDCFLNKYHKDSGYRIVLREFVDKFVEHVIDYVFTEQKDTKDIEEALRNFFFKHLHSRGCLKFKPLERSVGPIEEK